MVWIFQIDTLQINNMRKPINPYEWRNLYNMRTGILIKVEFTNMLLEISY